MTDVMLDLKTLGNTPDAAILSIGAVKFDLYAGPDAPDFFPGGFYDSIDIESNLAHGRSIDEAALLWWLERVRDGATGGGVFFEPKTPLSRALDALRAWIAPERDATLRIWGGGPTIPVLTHAYAQREQAPPWDLDQVHCVRTITTLSAALPFAFKRAPIQSTQHALEDARNQARHMRRVVHCLCHAPREEACA